MNQTPESQRLIEMKDEPDPERSRDKKNLYGSIHDTDSDKQSEQP